MSNVKVMVVAAFIVSVVALLVSGLAVVYTRIQAKSATNADRRARRPKLNVVLDEGISRTEKSALYFVENTGEEDLDSVLVRRPVTSDGVRYPVARLGQDFGDEAELGPLEIKAKQGLVLCVGSGERLPDFRVRVKFRIGNEKPWEDVYELDNPRPDADIF